MLKIKYIVDKIVMQPTSICNLNCAYCYLPNRDKKNVMSTAVSKLVSAYVKSENKLFSIIWHGGEPLACTIEHFKTLIDPFKNLNVNHSIQTNGTLIDEKWCELFIDYKINIGVSLDGDKSHNIERLSWNGKPSFDAVSKGIKFLRKFDIPFHIICVVNKNNISYAKELYRFFVETGCWSVGFNIEEIENNNSRELNISQESIVQFWKILFEEWRKNPLIRIREFDSTLTWMKYHIKSNGVYNDRIRIIDIFPSVAYNGDIVLLSPEFLDSRSEEYSNFIVGNILLNSLDEILAKKGEIKYVEDFKKGLNNCYNECEYFKYCGGGFSSNKFFENKNLLSTKTRFCQNSRINVVDSIIKSI